MIRLKLSFLLQCFICFLLLWPGIVHSFPSTELSHRYEREASETVFTTGELDLALQSDTEFRFKMCCNKNDGCSPGSFLFCFPTTQRKQARTSLHGCGDGTCAYKVEYNGNDEYSLSGGIFSSSDKCFDGKLTMTNIIVSYKDKTSQQHEDLPTFGCPFNITQPGNRLILDVREIPAGVTVSATNAKKYVEPTTLPPTTTPAPTEPSTAETTNAIQERPTPAAASSEKKTEETSDTLLYIFIGVGILVFILIAGGIAFAIYWFCCKKKKSSKPVPPDTVAKTVDDTTPVTKKSPVVKDKTKESKIENETKDVERSKLASSTLKTDASKLKTEDPFDDETGHGGKSMSKKSQE